MSRALLRTVGSRLGRSASVAHPPRDLPLPLELLNRPGDAAFITGNGIASRCRWVLNYGPPIENAGGREGWYFCKADYVEYFFERHLPDGEFVLFTHNSDLPVGREARRHLRRRTLRGWFATNVAYDHPKLHPLPIGIANPRWPHGDVETIRRVQRAALPKTRLFDSSFSVETNPVERAACVSYTGLTPGPPLPFERYLRSVASSYFCVSPSGNGIDCHRTWEAFYLGTVPVVTRSALTEQHADLPWVVIDDWSQFRSIDFSADLFERVRAGWSSDALSLDRYLERVGERAGRRSG